MKIGYCYNSYPYKRCIIDKTKNTYVYYNFKNLRYIVVKLFEKAGLLKYWDARYKIHLPDGICDLWHTFNQMVIGKTTPYVITFETQVPRTNATIERDWEWKEKTSKSQGKLISQQLQELERSNCKKLIAISQSAYNIESDMIERFAPSDRTKNALINLLTVVYPPQSLLVTEEEINKKWNAKIDKLKFIFIGNDYYRKGGALCVKALEKFADNYFFELILVGKISDRDFLCPDGWNREKEIESLKQKPWIKYYGQLDNERALRLMKSCHVGLLPTMQDTYGYSLLEMQACGLPVITTAIRALIEINNDICGWMIPVDTVGPGNEAKYHTAEQRKKLESDILRGLEERFGNILNAVGSNDTAELHTKALKSWERVKKYHEPESVGQELTKIYEEVLQ